MPRVLLGGRAALTRTRGPVPRRRLCAPERRPGRRERRGRRGRSGGSGVASGGASGLGPAIPESGRPAPLAVRRLLSA